MLFVWIDQRSLLSRRRQQLHDIELDKNRIEKMQLESKQKTYLKLD